MTIDALERVYQPPDMPETPFTAEVYVNGERLSHYDRADVCLHMIELAAMQQLVDNVAYTKKYLDGLRGYIEHIQPLIEAMRIHGLDGADDIVNHDWEATEAARKAHKLSDRSHLPRELTTSDLANLAYRRLDLTYGRRMTTTAKLAVWTLYVADPQESILFCSEQGMFPYLADAPTLVDFLAEDRVRNGISTGEDGLVHIQNVHPYIRRYMLDYADERNNRHEAKRLIID